jgi:hypothetical protein
VDLALVAGVFVADSHHLIVFSKTPYVLAIGWLSMAARGINWRDVGLSIDGGWLRSFGIGVGAGAAMEALALFVTQPLVVGATGNYPDLSVFSGLVGNLRLLLLMVAFSWLVAGLGEELV